MATTNPFDLLGDDDNDDLSVLIASAAVIKKSSDQATAASAAPPAKPAKLPTKPPPPAQAVRDAKTEASRGGGHGRGRGNGQGRGGGGGGGFNRNSIGGDNTVGSDNGFPLSYKYSEDRESGRPSERRGGYGSPRGGFRGGRRGGFSDGHSGEGERPRRVYERHSGTGRGDEIKRDGAGRGNWGTATDEIPQETEEPAGETDAAVAAEEKVVEEENVEAEKENPVNEPEEKEPEEKQMTLEEYVKVLEEKRKALLVLKTEERKVDVDKEFESMHLVSKKGDDAIFIKLGSEKDKRKDAAEKEERAKKAVSINEFLKPAAGETYYRAGGRGRGRGGRGSREGFGGSNGTNNASDEVPANLLFTKNLIRPGVFLGTQMFILGVCSMCQGLTGSYGGLLASRFLMGIFEAALPAGATYMISVYYTKREAAVRFAWFFNFALAGPLFSGLLAYAIAGIDGAGGYEGWRWIFIIEGLMTVVLSVAMFTLCPNFPQHAQSWFLRPDQRERLVATLEASRGQESAGSAADDVSIWKILLDWRVHLFTMCFFCCDVTAGSVSAFSPTILAELGWTDTEAQLMTMPIWAAGIVSTFTITWLASYLNLRTPFVLLSLSAVLAGWIIMVVYVPAAGVRYFALFLMAMGTFPQMAIYMSWMGNNLRGRKILAVGTAWMIGFGNCANFVSSNVFIKSQSPYYPTGFSTGLAFTVVGMALVTGTFVLLTVKNKKRDARRSQMSDEEKEKDDEVNFRYVI